MPRVAKGPPCTCIIGSGEAVCSECGSTNISYDAVGWWNRSERKLVFDTTDGVCCQDCGYDGNRIIGIYELERMPREKVR